MDGYDDLRPSKHAGVKRLSDEITCEICEGVLRDPATLPCCHTFCLACVEDKLQGHGVYESKCPQCGMPLHFKDLRVNQTYNGVIEQIESALARFAAESTRVEEKDADAREPRSRRSDAGEVPRARERRALDRRRVGVPRGASRDGDERERKTKTRDGAGAARPRRRRKRFRKRPERL